MLRATFLTAATAMIVSGLTMAQQSKPADTQPKGPYMQVKLDIAAGGVERSDRPVEVQLDLSSLAAKAGRPRAEISPRSLQLAEVDAEGKVLDATVPFQFDLAEDCDQKTHVKGELVFMLAGRTAAKATRHFVLQFGGRGVRTEVKPQVTVTDDVEHEKQKSFRIATTGGTYLYHKQGAGFASLIDADGNDWISYKPTGGPAGNYRGIPNLVHPEGHFHPGGTDCRSRLLVGGPLRASIESTSTDGKWATRWDIFPTFARLTVLKAAGPYWFLYEGTPGGALDLEGDFCIRPGGVRTKAADKWDQALGNPEWVAFGDAKLKRVLFIAHHDPDNCIDSYWPMQGSMTVFGFGRQGTRKFMTATPNRFTIGLSDESRLDAAMNSAYRDIAVTIGQPEIQN